MDYEIKQVKPRKIAGFHMVGPWAQTVKQGFEQLMKWVDGQQIPAQEWLAVYYDNPDDVPAEKLRCDTVVSVADDFVVPANSEGVMTANVAGGLYAAARARVIDHDFSTPWYQFFDSVLKDEKHRMVAKPCFEIYHNNGAEDGYWDIEMFVAVEPKS